MADGVVFLPSYYEAIKDLPESDRLQMYDAILRYGLYGELIELPPALRAMLTLIKPNIDASQNRYRSAKENGSKGGAPLGNQNARKKQPENNQTVNQNINQDIHSESEIYHYDMDADSEKPTLEEVKMYCREIGSTADPVKFYDYYSVRGWRTGNDVMRDWRAVFRKWSNDEKPKPNAKGDFKPNQKIDPDKLASVKAEFGL